MDMKEKIDESWMKDGTPVFFNSKGVYLGRFEAVIDGEVKDVGIPGIPCHVVRLRQMDEAWIGTTGCHFAACVSTRCIERRSI
jgi:hypothetical protein